MTITVEPPPFTPVEPVTDVVHGQKIIDPFRWLEDQESAATRRWLDDQVGYSRRYLENIPGRSRIRQRIGELLTVETHDCFQAVGQTYFFRKRLPEQEQPCIYMRSGVEGDDVLLVNPADQGKGSHIAVQPIRASKDGRFLVYEVKEGGERTGSFEIFDIANRRTLAESLPRGYLRGIVFSPDGKGFFYTHEPIAGARRFYRAVYYHTFGDGWENDQEVFCAGEDEKVYLCLISDGARLGFIVYKCTDEILIDFFVKEIGSHRPPAPLLLGADYRFRPFLVSGRIFAVTDLNAPNFRVVELRPSEIQPPEWVDIVPERENRIVDCVIAGEHILINYIHGTSVEVCVFDFAGRKTDEIPVRPDETVRLIGDFSGSDEVFLEQESFTEPISVFRYSATTQKKTLWTRRTIRFDADRYRHHQISYTATDGTRIPMFLVGRRDILDGGIAPTIMTSYGGFGMSMTPQFSAFVAFLMEHGCLFALPNIRGGSEFGAQWHTAAKRRNRHVAYSDFLSAAEWLIQNGRTTAERLAIFGGSNSGLLVGVALTKRPDLFRAVVCMVPLLDMLRYHLFDTAHIWREEYGTAEDPEDFAALAGYSPYHKVKDGDSYPAVLLISGDSDQSCNPLHARKMAARLQQANASEHPILLSYSKFRGHSPVLPLSERIEALTDRMAFLCDQLQLAV